MTWVRLPTGQDINSDAMARVRTLRGGDGKFHVVADLTSGDQVHIASELHNEESADIVKQTFLSTAGIFPVTLPVKF